MLFQTGIINIAIFLLSSWQQSRVVFEKCIKLFCHYSVYYFNDIMYKGYIESTTTEICKYYKLTTIYVIFNLIQFIFSTIGNYKVFWRHA